jgi:XTP/dITP diphosphohydrolase
MANENDKRVDALVIATRNSGKLVEFQKLFSGIPLSIGGLDEFDFNDDIEETGNSFIENADMKASGYAAAIGKWTLADDSGLEVAALGGRPGIFSARYGGLVSAAERNEMLLNELNELNAADRSARFVCAISISDPSGRILTRAEGFCGGNIAFESRGRNGFGYDPIFIPDDFDRTLGELSLEIKQKISHRAKASVIILRYLRDFIAG